MSNHLPLGDGNGNDDDGQSQQDGSERAKQRYAATTAKAIYKRAEGFQGRRADVMRWLGHWIERGYQPPTSGELAAFVLRSHRDELPHDWSKGDVRLYVRRGLSDLKAANCVATGVKRTCAATHLSCETWRPSLNL